MTVLTLKDQSYWENRLVEGGFTPEQARILVELDHVDLHRVEALVLEGGCDPAVAFDIFS